MYGDIDIFYNNGAWNHIGLIPGHIVEQEILVLQRI